MHDIFDFLAKNEQFRDLNRKSELDRLTPTTQKWSIWQGLMQALKNRTEK